MPHITKDRLEIDRITIRPTAWEKFKAKVIRGYKKFTYVLARIFLIAWGLGVLAVIIAAANH